MDVAISGSHGLIGSALVTSLEADGHLVRPIIRTSDGRQPGRVITYDAANSTLDRDALEGVDAIVNLAGAPIAGGPFTHKHKRKILDTRMRITGAIASAVAGLDHKPAVVISGSAIGIYGAHRGDEELTESSATGSDFLADLCTRWEAQAAPIANGGVRLAYLRTGLVLARDGGMLKPQLRPFKLGLGGPAGPGTQWWSWMHLADEVTAIRFLIDNDVEGPVNLTAPAPVRNAEFAATLGRVLNRPAKLRIPKLLAKAPAPLGELFDNLLFASQRVVPAKLTAAGFSFAHSDLEAALRNLLG